MNLARVRGKTKKTTFERYYSEVLGPWPKSTQQHHKENTGKKKGSGGEKDNSAKSVQKIHAAVKT